MHMRHHIPIITLVTALIAGLSATPAVEAAEAKPVDVFIGDSSAVQGAYSDGTTPAQRWTRLFSDADGADEVNVAVGGTGFVVGGANTFAKQADKANAATKGRNVRRVFVVGIGNDMSAQAAGRITTGQISRALLVTMPKIAAAWPGAQKLYVPEASPMTAKMKAAYQRMSPYMSDIYQGVKLIGFTSLERWDTMVDGDGTSKDGTHLNVKGNNLMAHAMQKWVNTLDGPKNTGTIPEWKDPNPTSKMYTVSFDGAQGSKTDPVKAEAGKPVAKPKDPTRDGYEFQGWTLDGKPYDFATPVSKDITLTAVWAKKDKPTPTPVTHTVTFDPNRQGMSVPPQTVRDGGTATPVTLDSGLDENGSKYWLFSGWMLDGKPFDFTTPVTRDITLVAAWGVMPSERVTVTFAGDGVDVPAQRLNIGEKAAKPSDPKREGYTFKGWTLDGKPYDFTIPVPHDLTLTAAWTPANADAEPVAHTVAFDTGSNRFARTVTHGGHVARPSDPTRDGYTFTGWTLDGSPYDFSTPVVADITLTAAWTKRESTTSARAPALPATGAGIIPLTLLVIGMLATGGTILYLAHRKH